MAAIKRIPVSPEILEELSRLKEPEQTFGELIAGMIERENKFRLLKDMKRIEKMAEFVEIPEGPRSYKPRCSKIRGFAY